MKKQNSYSPIPNWRTAEADKDKNNDDRSHDVYSPIPSRRTSTVSERIENDARSHKVPSTPKKKIAILGLRQSGKSTFLTVLELALALKGSPWKVRPVGNTISRMNELRIRLFDLGLYPEPTPEGEDPLPMRFHVEREASLFGLMEGDWFELQATDVPGGAVQGVIGGIAFQNFYETYVKDCAAVIFLIDPQEKWLEDRNVESGLYPYFPVFSSILAELGEQNSDKVYAAFCMTKLDREPDVPVSFVQEGYWEEEDLEEKAVRVLGKGVKASIDHFFNPRRLRWFPVSATGYLKEGGGQRSQFTMRYDGEIGEEVAGIAKPSELAPVGVAEVVEWVFDSIARDDIRARDTAKFGKKVAKLLERLKREVGI